MTALGSATHWEVIRFSDSSSFFVDHPGAKHHDPADLLVDGFIARTFGSEDANSYFKILLREPSSKHFLQYYRTSHHQSAWYITHNSNLVQCTSPGIPLQSAPLLDYSVTAYGTVVPQRRWTPDSKVTFRQSVEKAVLQPRLQLPIFFVNRNGGLGFRLPDILRGCDRDLQNANDFAPLGHKSMTSHIRIGVSLQSPSRQIYNCHILTRSAKPPVVAQL